MNDKQEFIDIVETVYRGARKGRGLVISPKGTHTDSCIYFLYNSTCILTRYVCADYSTKYRY